MSQPPDQPPTPESAQAAVPDQPAAPEKAAEPAAPEDAAAENATVAEQVAPVERPAAEPVAVGAGQPVAVGAPAAQATLPPPPPTGPLPPPAGIPPGYPPPPGYWGPQPLPPRKPAPPTFTQTRWIGPVTPADWYVIGGILLGGLGFALALPLSRPGIGWPVAGIAAGLGVAVAARRSTAAISQQDRIMRIIWAVAALALLVMSAIRSSGLLTFFSAITALACASLAAAGGQSLRGMLFGIVAAPFAGLRSIGWVSTGLQTIAKDRAERKAAAGDQLSPEEAAERRGRTGNIVVSVVIAVILLLIFGGLFASADAVFAHYLDAAFSRIGKIIPDLDGANLILRLFLLAVGLVLAAGGIFLATAPPDLSGMQSPGKQVLGREVLLAPLGALVVLFAGFVAVQFTALFGGNEYVLHHSQINYADYAVGGFQQLVVVSILTLIIVGVAARWGRKDNPAERLFLRILLGSLCVLSIVIVWSALSRLNLYVNTYGLTRQRFAVFMLEIFLGVMFALVLLAGVRMKAQWLTRAVFGVGVVMLLGASMMNPERWIAQHNIDRYMAGEKIDLYYLSAMTADAVPALVNLPEDERNCVLGQIQRDLKQNPDEWFEWNWARENARHILATDFPNGFGRCNGRRAYDYQSR
jgi:Domain of unknown function (DUF4173)